MPDAVCIGCKERTLPDPMLDQLTLARCPMCGARYIRLHYAEDWIDWRRLKWWQRF